MKNINGIITLIAEKRGYHKDRAALSHGPAETAHIIAASGFAEVELALLHVMRELDDVLSTIEKAVALGEG